MRIIKIQVKDFRAFRGEYTIDLHASGHNLLLYGENGSGKSSLFQALNLFFSPPATFSDHKNIFVTADDGFVKLEISDSPNPSRIYEWEQVTHPFTETLIVDTAKTKGFLDYRALLETHYVHRQANSVNVFNLLINTLLATIPNPITRRNFSEEWQLIQETAKTRQSKRRTERLTQLLPDFNAGLINTLVSITDKANELLGFFEQAVTIQLTLPNLGLEVHDGEKIVANQSIELTASFYGRQISRHHHFLNEARLSAIAITIYLSMLLLNPPSQLRVLFMDDVLIGLDMSNRLPLLAVLAQYFPDWQIILTTYDRVWFEMVRQRVNGWVIPWSFEEFFCVKSDEGDLPVHAPQNDYLARAQHYLGAGDLKASAIYIRSAYEHEIKRFCNKYHLPVPYYENSKKQMSEDFWQVVKNQKWDDDTDVLDSNLRNQIELCRASILNQLSHTAPVNLVRREVEDALNAVNEMKVELRQNKKLK